MKDSLYNLEEIVKDILFTILNSEEIFLEVSNRNKINTYEIIFLFLELKIS